MANASPVQPTIKELYENDVSILRSIQRRIDIKYRSHYKNLERRRLQNLILEQELDKMRPLIRKSYDWVFHIYRQKSKLTGAERDKITCLEAVRAQLDEIERIEDQGLWKHVGPLESSTSLDRSLTHTRTMLILLDQDLAEYEKKVEEEAAQDEREEEIARNGNNQGYSCVIC